MMTDPLRPRGDAGPYVAVLMPVFNAMPYLPAAVSSVLGQSWRDLTLIALDDGSTDGSREYLSAHPDPRLTVVGDGRHRGMGALLNHGMVLADAPLIARMDADDLCPPDRFARQVAALQSDPGLAAVGTQFQYFGQEGCQGFARKLPLDHDAIHGSLRRGVLAVIHASLMIRTEALRSIGGYRFNGIGEDWDMFLRLAEVGRFANLSNLGYLYRLHASNATMLHQRLTQRRIRFACACAEARRQGLPEPAEADWLADLDARPWHRRMAEMADGFSIAQYYTGRNLVLNRRSLRGYSHLALGMLANPRRTVGRALNLLARADAHARRIATVAASPATMEG